MNLQAQIDALESLSALDADLKELRAELEKENAGISGKRAQAAELKAKGERDSGLLSDMERQRGESVQEVRNMSLQIDKSREKLSRCRTEREANAVQRELEELRKLQRDREHEISKLDQLTEQARADIEKTEEQLEALRQELGESASDVETKLQELERQVGEAEARRATMIGSVEKRMYRRYEAIRKNRGYAVTYTTDGRCRACNMMLSPMVFQQLQRREGFDQCPSCSRIIYFREADPEAETAQTSGA